MQREFICSNEVVGAQIIVLISAIIRVIHLDFKPLRLLEVEVDKNLCHELRVEVVLDQLRLSYHLPSFVLFVDDHEWI